jgi:mannitol/fructose-specific phosphotransferase system IIA component (Ntr-type)
LDYTHLVGRLRDRELLGSTGMGEGVAIPHCSQSGIVEPLLAFGRSCEGVPFAALDGRLVNLFILLVTPESEAGLHLKLLARISRLMLDGGVRTRLMEAEDAAHFLAVIREQDLCP